MPCEAEGGELAPYHETAGYQEQVAANHIIFLLKHMGKWDGLDPEAKQKHENNANAIGGSPVLCVRTLCEMIREEGGTLYLDGEFSRNKTAGMAALYAWWLQHEEHDARRKAREAEVLARVARDRKIKEERERDERHRAVVRSRFKFLKV